MDVARPTRTPRAIATIASTVVISVVVPVLSPLSKAARKYLSVREATFIGVGAMVGAGIFALLGAAGEVSGGGVVVVSGWPSLGCRAIPSPGPALASRRPEAARVARVGGVRIRRRPLPPQHYSPCRLRKHDAGSVHLDRARREPAAANCSNKSAIWRFQTRLFTAGKARTTLNDARSTTFASKGLGGSV
jgi:hypothetical protein